MGNRVSRREFFREAGRTGLRRLAEVLGGLAASTRETEPIPEMDHDFSPELLALEAKRLGLDPVKDRNKIVKAVYEALGKAENTASDRTDLNAMLGTQGDTCCPRGPDIQKTS